MVFGPCVHATVCLSTFLCCTCEWWEGWSSSPNAFAPHLCRAVTPGSPTSRLLSKCYASTNSSWWVYLSEVICCKWTKPAGFSTANPINCGRWPFWLWSSVPGHWPHSAQLNYANTRGGFLQEDLAESSRKPQLLPPCLSFDASTAMISCYWLAVLCFS